MGVCTVCVWKAEKVGETPDEHLLGRLNFKDLKDIAATFAHKYRSSDAQAHIQTDGSPDEKEVRAGEGRRELRRQRETDR